MKATESTAIDERASEPEDFDGTMQRRQITLSDGRYLIFYDFNSANPPVADVERESQADAGVGLEEEK